MYSSSKRIPLGNCFSSFDWGFLRQIYEVVSTRTQNSLTFSVSPSPGVQAASLRSISCSSASSGAEPGRVIVQCMFPEWISGRMNGVFTLILFHLPSFCSPTSHNFKFTLSRLRKTPKKSLGGLSTLDSSPDSVTLNTQLWPWKSSTALLDTRPVCLSDLCLLNEWMVEWINKWLDEFPMLMALQTLGPFVG